MDRDKAEPGSITDALTLVAARRRVDDRVMQAEIGAALLPDESKQVEIGRFVVIDHLGTGAMGSVYRAYDPQLDRRVAVKVISADAMHPEFSPARLLREATALARLNHPNVVTVYEAGQVGDEVFLAMELVEGTNLAEWALAEGPGGDVALDYLVQAARGLAAAHRAGVVHRDFKPANVLVGGDGRVRVADFGLARTVGRGTATFQRPAGVDRDRFVVNTGTGLIVGTPRYMAPEQRAGKEVDARADQFAFCIVAWELWFGRHPWRGGVPGPQPIAAPPGASPAIVDVLRRGLSLDPRDRFASMDELATRLEACRSPHQPTSRRWIVAAVLALALVGGLAWWGRGSIDADDATVQHETQPGHAVEQVERENVDARPSPVPSADPVPPSPESPSVSPPSTDQAATSPTDEPPTTIDDAPASTRNRSRPRSAEPPSDARVLADVRTAATRACAAQTGTAEVTVDFLVQADGRPALIRARPSGNARTGCVEKQLRAARFRTGVDRRATLRVPFEA